MDETLSSSRFGPAPFTGRPGAVAFARTSAARAASDSAALFWASAICIAIGRFNQATRQKGSHLEQKPCLRVQTEENCLLGTAGSPCASSLVPRSHESSPPHQLAWHHQTDLPARWPSGHILQDGSKEVLKTDRCKGMLARHLESFFMQGHALAHPSVLTPQEKDSSMSPSLQVLVQAVQERPHQPLRGVPVRVWGDLWGRQAPHSPARGVVWTWRAQEAEPAPCLCAPTCCHLSPPRGGHCKQRPNATT